MTATQQRPAVITPDRARMLLRGLALPAGRRTRDEYSSLTPEQRQQLAVMAKRLRWDIHGRNSGRRLWNALIAIADRGRTLPRSWRQPRPKRSLTRNKHRIIVSQS